MASLGIVRHKEKEILVIDYSDAKPAQMIELVERAMQLIADNGMENVLLLTILNERNYVTPAFMRKMEGAIRQTDSAVIRIAVVGLSSVQKWILKGVNLWDAKGLKEYETIEEAKDYLVE